ncbi:MAG: PAS domain-containing protein, partial [Actinobacteria bacterium]|nr:PAS domain-containing protein [Actinomycetota bacterium]
MEYRMLAEDGRVVWIRDEAVVVARDQAGRPTLWQGVIFDVTEQKRIERERRDLLRRLVGAQEEERRRIAGDIHDDSVQMMTAVGLRLQALRKRETSEEKIEAIDRLEQSVSLAIGRLRHLLFELRPPAIDRDGLAAALRQYLEDVRDEAGIEVHLDDRLVTEP